MIDIVTVVMSPDAFKALWNVQVALEQAAEWLDAEPAPRAISPITYDAKRPELPLRMIQAENVRSRV